MVLIQLTVLPDACLSSHQGHPFTLPAFSNSVSGHRLLECSLSFAQAEDAVVFPDVGDILWCLADDVSPELQGLRVDMLIGIHQLQDADGSLLVGRGRQECLVLGQQQDAPFVGALYLDDLQVAGMSLQFILDGMESLRTRIEGVELPVDGLQPQRALGVLCDAFNLTWWNVGISLQRLVVGDELAPIESAQSVPGA